MNGLDCEGWTGSLSFMGRFECSELSAELYGIELISRMNPELK